MSCYVKSYNIHHVMLYSICSEYVIQQNRTCYMTYVQNMLYNMCHVLLYNICHVMLYNICLSMLYSICHVMLNDL